MIVQFNLLDTERSRQYGHKLFYHWKPNYPNDQEVVQLLSNYYALEFKIRERNRISEPFIIENGRGEAFAEVFPIFCTYDKYGNISHEYREFRDLEWENNWFKHYSDCIL